MAAWDVIGFWAPGKSIKHIANVPYVSWILFNGPKGIGGLQWSRPAIGAEAVIEGGNYGAGATVGILDTGVGPTSRFTVAVSQQFVGGGGTLDCMRV